MGSWATGCRGAGVAIHGHAQKALLHPHEGAVAESVASPLRPVTVTVPERAAVRRNNRRPARFVRSSNDIPLRPPRRTRLLR